LVFFNIPIARYLCRQSRKLSESAHRTFSLLPHFFVPYHQHDLDIILNTLNHQNQHPKPSLVDTVNHISALGKDDNIPLENSHICHFRTIFEEAFYKIISIPDLNNLVRLKDPVENILDISDRYKTPFQTTSSMNCSNVQQLAWDFFYNFQTTPFFDRHFLFGTPSQKRR
jgi:hypothetical protein